ncbi:MAG: AAA domain-containing protein, partial [Desulfobacteraceae bacterium]|nr:AAA domain-containing protein [Desulfobacteraceae bacterium]
LFICGGTFTGLEKIVERRLHNKSMGFGAAIQSNIENNIGELLGKLLPEDLIKFGLIPEFLGRLPIITSIGELNEDSLVKILTEPKNALIKQYKELFRMEGIALQFTDEALTAIAKEAVKRKSGARGLRAILEEAMLEIMFELPSKNDVKECVIGEEVILDSEKPILLFEQNKKQA